MDDRDKKNWVHVDTETAGAASVSFYERMKLKIIGQDRALKRFADAVEISEAKFRRLDKPIYSVMFAGPSGVGKTEILRGLAELWFNDRNALTILEGQTMSEPHSISRLIGSPPGYIGFGEHGLTQDNIDKPAKTHDTANAQVIEMLNEAENDVNYIEQHIFRIIKKRYSGNDFRSNDVLDKSIKLALETHAKLKNRLQALRNKVDQAPSSDLKSIILFDELEKASSKHYEVCMNIIDTARITLANGQITKFNNSVIAFTTNVNEAVIAKYLSRDKGIGFQDLVSEDDDTKKDEIIYEASMREIRRFFNNTFLARLDDIIVFRHLSNESLYKIFELELNKFSNLHIRPLGITLDMSEEVKRFIVTEATDKREWGARLLAKKIDQYLIKPMARLKNRNELAPGDILHVVLHRDSSINKSEVRFFKESLSDMETVAESKPASEPQE